MRTLDIVLAWLLIAFGALHASLTRRVHPNLDIDAVWFASGGLLIIAIGALDLLRVVYGSVARGVYFASVTANVVLLAMMLYIAGLLPIRGNPQVLIGLILTTSLTVLSAFRRGGHIRAA